jgi:hypothetical protein
LWTSSMCEVRLGVVQKESVVSDVSPTVRRVYFVG